MARTSDPMTKTLERMLEKEIGKREKRPSRLARLLGRREGTSQASRTSGRSGDLTVAALGLTIGLICALFPWYIFFNQDKFGIRALKFGGGGDVVGRLTVPDQPHRVGAPMQVEDIPELELDLFATGTLPELDEARDVNLPGIDQQPFPGEPQNFRLVHVANGRAMIEDDSGLWVVQRGSKLPDNSTVALIELRDGDWVIVTSEDKVIRIE
jgi:hypothetical protein